jgi:ABC-type Zn uptake system ZnuABC Zn-binding protein ZnuA
MKRVFVPILVVAVSLMIGGGIFAQEAVPLNVIATTTILADVARSVGGEFVNVESLLPPNADAHAYEPTVEDASRVAGADMLLVVGAGYEEFLGGLLEAVGEDIPVVVVSNGLEIIAIGEHGHSDEDEAEEEGEEHAAGEVLGVLGEGLACEAHEEEADAAVTEEAEEEHAGECDPHVWTNPLNVIRWVENIADAFAAADPDNADWYYEYGNEYAALMEALDQDVQEVLAIVPEERRVLVTNHEFMGYFARQYGFEIAATVLPGGSTSAEPDPQTLAELIEFVAAQGVPAIFAEVSANPEMAELVASEAGIAVVTTLYSESLSDADGSASTYADYILFNAQTIAAALR